MQVLVDEAGQDDLRRKGFINPVRNFPEKLRIPLAERILYKNAEKLFGMSIDD